MSLSEKLDLAVESQKEKERLELDFERLWSLYPRREGKRLANKTFHRRTKEGYSVGDIEKAVKRYVKEKEGIDKKYLKQGNSFFGERIFDYFDDNYKKKLEEEKTRVKEEKERPKEVLKYKIEGYEELLETFSKMPYKEYLLTEHWKHFRKEALKFYGYKCQLCNEKNKELCVHHKTYENKGRETFNDITVLCEECHKLVHGVE